MSGPPASAFSAPPGRHLGDRIDVLQQKLASAKALEALMQGRKEAARVAQADVLLAKSRRLAVEIELLKAQE